MKTIEINTTVNATPEQVWDYWTQPKHITQWNSASDEWHTPKAENDLKRGGRFVYRMESKDGKIGFDFGGKYDKVESPKLLAYSLDDNRAVTVEFTEKDGQTVIKETFEPENENPIDMQKDGWQAILDNFKAYVEKDTNGNT